ALTPRPPPPPPSPYTTLFRSPGTSRSPSWAFTGEGGASFQCSLTRGATPVSAFAPCTSPKSYDLTGQPDGTYTFHVKQTDAAGNIGTAHACTPVTNRTRMPPS